MAKTKRWGTVQDNELVKQFNLFVSSGGKKGWDPERKTDHKYIISKLKNNVHLGRYLSKSNGGDSGNKDNQKALRGYIRVACEFFLSLAAKGVRKGASLSSRWRSVVAVQPDVYFVSLSHSIPSSPA
jgi:hypothetical protein